MRLAFVGSIPILSLFLTAQAFAQAQAPSVAPSAQGTAEDSEPQTLSSGTANGPMHVTGWFVAPTVGTTGFDGRLAYSPGLRGGVYLNRRLAIGLTAQALGSGGSAYGKQVRNVGTYGGLLLEYVIQSNRLVHATLESTIGPGKWCVLISDENDGCSGRGFLAFEPVANLEINLSRHVRFATGAGYRFAVAGSGPGPTSRDMSSLVARSSLIFGSF